MKHSRKPVIGIIGGIGSGKSTVAAELARLGGAVIDADRIGHDLLKEPGVRNQLRRRWGERIFNSRDQVDRKALGDIVFSDTDELDALNVILHPLIRRRMESFISRAHRGGKAAIVDAAVLVEAGWDDLCTHLVFVDCPPSRRLRRVVESRGWDEATWRRREKTQKTLDTKARMCDYTIENSSSVSHLVDQIRSVYKRIVSDSDRS